MTGLSKSSVQRFEIAPGFTISRIIKGGWQLSQGHSQGITTNPLDDMSSFVDQGITSFDCADIYTGVEELIGKFLTLRKKRFGNTNDIQVLTKFVPDYDALSIITKVYAEKIIDRSLKRLGLDRLDMVQFSWWSYDVPRWVETAGWLQELQRAGKIRLISGTNFNTSAAKEILDAGISFATLQIQYSLLDNRPDKSLVALCKEKKVHLLCYGTVAGGFLSERWLNVAEPKPPFENRSLVKYKLMIDEFGGWELFQSLLQALKSIADRHQVNLTNVAARYILDRPQVAGIIVGARGANHLKENLRVFDLRLDSEDQIEIDRILKERKGPSGDVFDVERIKDGPHGAIMKYNLNSNL